MLTKEELYCEIEDLKINQDFLEQRFIKLADALSYSIGELNYRLSNHTSSLEDLSDDELIKFEKQNEAERLALQQWLNGKHQS
tara:strand:+ start:76 stop:324 length:249 start_codon:yes stop_codon:yes gene_type:complete